MTKHGRENDKTPKAWKQEYQELSAPASSKKAIVQETPQEEAATRDTKVEEGEEKVETGDETGETGDEKDKDRGEKKKKKKKKDKEKGEKKVTVPH